MVVSLTRNLCRPKNTHQEFINQDARDSQSQVTQAKTFSRHIPSKVIMPHPLITLSSTMYQGYDNHISPHKRIRQSIHRN